MIDSVNPSGKLNVRVLKYHSAASAISETKLHIGRLRTADESPNVTVLRSALRTFLRDGLLSVWPASVCSAWPSCEELSLIVPRSP